MSSVYSLMRDELDSRGLHLPSSMLEQMAASVGGHVLTLANLDSSPPIYQKHGMPENYRNHLVFMAPSGWGKSVLFRSMLRSKDGVLSGLSLFNTSVRGTFSTESWLGTKVQHGKGGDIEDTGGVFQRFKRGMVGADEYQPLKLIFEGEGLGHDEVYLMTALDTDYATKDLSFGEIEVSGIGLTLWAGMRPTPITLKSGVARRFMFEVFFPSRETARLYKKMSREADKSIVNNIQDDMEKATTSLHKKAMDLGRLDIDYTEVNTWLGTMDFPHFEEDMFRRLAVGLAMSRDEYPDIIMSKPMEDMLRAEARARMLLRTSPWSYMMYCILKDEPGEEMMLDDLMRYLMTYYQMLKKEAQYVISEAKFDGIVKFIDYAGKGKCVRLVKEAVFWR